MISLDSIRKDARIYSYSNNLDNHFITPKQFLYRIDFYLDNHFIEQKKNENSRKFVILYTKFKTCH